MQLKNGVKFAHPIPIIFLYVAAYEGQMRKMSTHPKFVPYRLCCILVLRIPDWLTFYTSIYSEHNFSTRYMPITFLAETFFSRTTIFIALSNNSAYLFQFAYDIS